MSLKKFETSYGDKYIEMVDFDGRNIPKTVYKYRDWHNEYHKSILIRQEIFFPTANTFNDPFDCNITFDISPYKDNMNLQIEFWTRYLVISKHLNDYEAQKNAKEKINNNEFTLEKIEELSIEQAKSAQKEIGVYSVTAINDNPLMWAHYANNHHGFCIGFDTLKLFQFLISKKNDNLGSFVNYCNSYSRIPINTPPKEIIIGQIFSKAKYWDYEIEYRICKFFSPNTLFILPKEIISEIILGCNININDELNILSICESHLSSVKIYKAMPRKNSFEFEIKELK